MPGSLERIHRWDVIGMGVLPLQFKVSPGRPLTSSSVNINDLHEVRGKIRHLGSDRRKCSLCREGTRWKTKILRRTEQGEAASRTSLLLDKCDAIDGRSFCPLGEASAGAVRLNVKPFTQEFDIGPTRRGGDC